MIRLTLIVPTYNRARYIAKSLASFLTQDLNPAKYEILVVDNNCTDETRKVTAEVMKHAKCGWDYLVEPNQGLHYARNTGIVKAQGDIIVFGDDDIIASDSWLSTILEEFDHHPTTGIAGGKIVPLWNKQPEVWIYDYGTQQSHPLFAYLDYGDERLVLEHEYVYGCNFAFRRNIALEIGGSYPDTFPRRLKHLSGSGECGMIDHARAIQYEIVYLPDAVVFHHADVSRMTLDYFIDRYERWAIEEVYAAFRHNSKITAVQHLIALAIHRLEDSETESDHAINPEYYRIIHKYWAYQVIKQTCRVLTEPPLYEHIRRTSYFT